MFFNNEIANSENDKLVFYLSGLVNCYVIMSSFKKRDITTSEVKWNEMKWNETAWIMKNGRTVEASLRLTFIVPHLVIDRENAIKMKVIIIVSANLQENCWIIPIYTTTVALFNENSNSKQFITY